MLEMSKIRRFLKRVLIAIISIFGCFSLTITPTFAIEYNASGYRNIVSGSLSYWEIVTNTSVARSSYNISGGTASATGSINSGWVRASIQFDSYIPANSVVALQGRVCGAAGSFQGFTSNQYYSLIDSTTTQINDCTHFVYYFYAPGSYNNMYLGASIFYFDNLNDLMVIQGISYVTLKDSTISSAIERLDTLILQQTDQYNLMQTMILQNTDRYNRLGEIISKLDSYEQTIKDAAKTQADATDRQTEESKRQFDEEKAENQENKDSASKDNSSALSIFNFEFPNPFNWLFGGSLIDGCVSLPTISSWTYKEDSNFCPVFPQAVRNTLTPIINVIIILAVWRGVYKWMKGGGLGDDGLGDPYDPLRRSK